jgi:hypothetical protein
MKFSVKMPVKTTIAKECGATVANDSLPRRVIVTAKVTKPLLHLVSSIFTRNLNQIATYGFVKPSL